MLSAIIPLFEAADIPAIHEMLDAHPDLCQNQELLGRAVRHGNLAVVETVYNRGAQQVQTALGYLVYGQKADIGRFLLAKGADPMGGTGENILPIGACEVLNSWALQWAIDHSPTGLPPKVAQQCLAMTLSTYTRYPEGKAACLRILAKNGYLLPDTPVMRLHQGDIHALETWLPRTPELLTKTFQEADIYPPSLSIQPGDGLHLTPIDGTTLLHLAVAFHEIDLVKWLLQAGANPNQPANLDENGFGGHTPIFHTVVSYPPHSDKMARLLVAAGATTDHKVNLQKQFRYMGDPALVERYEFVDVDVFEYADQFQVPAWVNRVCLDYLKKQKSHAAG